MKVEVDNLTMEQVATSGRSLVLIDDGGTPGQKSDAKTLNPTRKTWVSVILNPKQVQEIAPQMDGTLDRLYSLTGAREFHFHQIYGGRGPFKDVPIKKRLGLFGFMAHIFRHYMFPVLVQTFDQSLVREFHSRATIPFKVGKFDFKEPTDLALFVMLTRLTSFLKENSDDYPSPVYCVIDAGFRDPDRRMDLPWWHEQFVDGGVYFADSGEFPLLQLADYAAFALSRSQWLAGKSDRSRMDNLLFPVIADIRLNILDLPEEKIDLATYTPADYDRAIQEDRISKGLPPESNS